MKRTALAAWIWYRGDRFAGFQAQPGGGTVQQTLQEALLAAGIRASVMPAGRTDKGVHARMQVISLAIPKARDRDELLRLRLPEGLGVVAVAQAQRSFHAQWSAIGKEYRYRIRLGPSPTPPEWEPYSWNPADEERLARRQVEPDRVGDLLRSAVGTRDFIAFHEKSSPRKLRTLESAEWRQLDEGLYEARLRGDSFGRHMVRYLVGSAVGAAAGVLSRDQYVAALERGAEMPGVRAPGKGLVLWEVRYPPALDPFAEERHREWNTLNQPPFCRR